MRLCRFLILLTSSGRSSAARAPSVRIRIILDSVIMDAVRDSVGSYSSLVTKRPGNERMKSGNEVLDFCHRACCSRSGVGRWRKEKGQEGIVR